MAYQIVANTQQFTAGIVASRAELKTLRMAFQESQTPAERYSDAIRELGMLAFKFPEKAEPMRRMIAAMREEMEAAAAAADYLGKSVDFGRIDQQIAAGSSTRERDSIWRNRIRANSASLEFSENARLSREAADARAGAAAMSRTNRALNFARGAANEAGFLSDLDAGLARNRARAKDFMAAQIPLEAGGGKSGMVLLKQNAEAASRAVSALNGGSVIPLLGSLAQLGPAAIAGVAAAGVGVLAAKSLMAADAARKAKEEFFKEVDALKELGGNTSFANHLDHVQSLSTAWSKAREEFSGYLAVAAERTGAPGALALAGDMVGAGIRGLREGSMTIEMRIEEELFKRAQERLAAEKKAVNERREAERTRMREWADFQEQMANSEKMAHDERMRELKERADETARVADKMRALFDETRTPAERMREKLAEINSLSGLDSIDPSIRVRALKRLEGEALDAIGGRGTPMMQSQTAIRAGSVEALRANFPGGTTQDEKALRAAEKTAKETAEAKGVLVEIRDAIKTQAIGVMP